MNKRIAHTYRLGDMLQRRGAYIYAIAVTITGEQQESRGIFDAAIDNGGCGRVVVN